MSAMQFVPFTNVVKLEMVFEQDTQICENVFHYQKEDPWTIAEMTTLAGAVKGIWYNSFAPLVSQTLELESVKVTDLSEQNAPGIEYTTGLPSTGNIVTAALPNNVTVVVTWLTNSRGRSFRGRTYHMGLVEEQVLQNQVKQTPLQSLATAYGQLLSINMGGFTAVLGIASRQHNGAVRTQGVFTPSIGCRVNSVVDSQRRRLPGRGR